MDALSQPQQSWPSIHITGTTGKGSTAALVASVLKEAGYTVGMYTSPHLVRFNERIQINGVQISDSELAQLIKEMRIVLDEKNIETTFFEFTTALAFLYFAKRNVDIAVIEVGMGGRLDATNVITPLVSVITNIGLDHEQLLGDTLEAIATEKAGIIKRGVPVVTGEKNPHLLALFEKVAQQKDAPVYTTDGCLSIAERNATLSGQSFSLTHSPAGDTEEYEMKLLGRHQLDNAATAWLTLHVIAGQGWRIEKVHIRSGFQQATWPGRMQVVSHKPLIIVDGAHNADGARVLYEYIKSFSRHDVLVLAVKRGKNPTFLLEQIVPLFREVVVTEGSYEPWPAHDLEKLVSQYASRVIVKQRTEEALAYAREYLPNDGLMLVTGSLYMIGKAIPLDYLR